MEFAPEYAVLLPAVILVLAGAFLPLMGAFRMRAGLLTGFTVLSVLAAGFFTIATLARIPGITASETGGFMPLVTADSAPIISFALLEWTPFVALFTLVFLVVALLVTLGSPRYIGERHIGEYYALILLSTTGMLMVAASRDLITLFVGLELSSFCAYTLAAFFKQRVDSSEAGMKYFLVGAISSSLALFGISIVYGLTGSTSFEALASLWQVQLPGGVTTIGDQLVGGQFVLGVFVWGLLLAGFGFKIAFVPFHNYAADVYQGAPSTVSGFLAAGSKQMGFAALFKVFILGLFAVKANWEVMIGVIAIVTMIVGNVAALSQTNLKRLLAYSSIGHAGYILIALAVGTEYALAGGLFHIVTYAIMQAGAFVALAAASTWGVGETFDEWKGMAKRAPLFAVAMSIFMLSFAGIPPLAGFASKFVLFSSAISAGGWYIWLAVVGIVTSAISLAYYWKLIRIMYVEETVSRRVAIGSSAAIALILAVAGTIAFGVFPAPVLDVSFDAARSLFAMRL